MIRFHALLALTAIGLSARAAQSDTVTLYRDGRFLMPVAADSCPEAVQDLRDTLRGMTGASIGLTNSAYRGQALHLGLPGEIGDRLPGALDGVGPEGCRLLTRDGSLWLLGTTERGVQHAVSTFLHHLGCRWFFPGNIWEVIPRTKTVEVALDERHNPTFPTQRRIWYGFGAESRSRADHEAWVRHNRMGSPFPMGIGHTWVGLNPDKDFNRHPEWFAEVEGRRQPSKPCYSHPDVLRKAIGYARARMEQGERMVSLTPPDGLGYCTCATCRQVLEGKEPFTEKNVLFGRGPDGSVVGLTSQNFFRFVNRVAEVIGRDDPDALLGCYAYSAYAHPPTFPLADNVYLQCTTAFRRTSLSLEEQLETFGRLTRQLGIREYFSVFQWDWDEPDPGKLRPDNLQETLRFYRDQGITAINAESSNNWGPRGLGYYLASQWMWDVDADRDRLLRDFYTKAFGPAARPMQRYYVRWYGLSAAVFEDRHLPEPIDPKAKPRVTLNHLRDAAGDLQAAVEATQPGSPERVRIEDLRLYLHYLVLRQHLLRAEESRDPARILEAIEAEARFGGHLTYTGMIHSRALLGKAFLRRFRKHKALLEPLGEKPLAEARQKTEPPETQTLERLWQDDLQFLNQQP